MSVDVSAIPFKQHVIPFPANQTACEAIARSFLANVTKEVLWVESVVRVMFYAVHIAMLVNYQMFVVLC